MLSCSQTGGRACDGNYLEPALGHARPGLMTNWRREVSVLRWLTGIIALLAVGAIVALFVLGSGK
jgi:hypothetical protein